MPRQFISPYAPRRRRSARLVLIWVATLLLTIWITWYISTRQRERAQPYVEEFMHPGSGGRRRIVHEAEEVF
jgi:hypothetical protein